MRRLQEPGAKITAGELGDLKADFGRSFEWRGFTATEVRSMREVSIQDRDRIRGRYKPWAREVLPSEGWGMALFCLVVGIGGMLWWARLHPTWPPPVDSLWLVIALFALAVVRTPIRRTNHARGHAEGYLCGYETGLHDGVNRALGISDEDDAFIDRVVLGLEMHQRLAKAATRKDEP